MQTTNRHAAFPAAPLLCAVAGTAAAQFRTFEQVILEGEQAFGFPAGVVYGSNGPAILAENGQVALEASLSGPGIGPDNNSGVFVFGSGGLLPIVLEGQPFPGATEPGQTWGSPLLRSFSDNGRIAFAAPVQGPGTTAFNDNVLAADLDGNGFAVIARDETQAPGAPTGVNYFQVSDGFGLQGASNGQTIVFESQLRGPGVSFQNNAAVFSNAGGSIALLAREGSQASGLSAGDVYGGNFGGFSTNAQGDFVFEASVSGPGINNPNGSNNGSVLYLQPAGGSLTPLAVTGDQAPGLPAGVQHTGFSSPLLNDAGQFFFETGLGGSGVTSDNNAAFYIATLSGGTELVAREGDQAIGYAAGVTYEGLNTPERSFNITGELAFNVELTGPGITDNLNDHALYRRAADGTTELFLRGGDQALGLAPGILYDTFDSLSLNDSGQFAFLAELSTGDDAYYATDPSTGDLVLLAAEGQLFNVSGDPLNPDFRVIDNLGTADGIQLNNRGEILIRLQLVGEDSLDGFFLVTVPAPGSAGVLALVGLAASRRRR